MEKAEGTARLGAAAWPGMARYSVAQLAQPSLEGRGQPGQHRGPAVGCADGTGSGWCRRAPAGGSCLHGSLWVAHAHLPAQLPAWLPTCLLVPCLLPSLPVSPCSPRTPHHVPRPWPHSRHLQDPAGCSPLQLPLPAHPQGRTAGAPRAQQGTPGTSTRSREEGTALSQAGCQQRAGSARGWQLPAPDRWSCNRTPDGFGKGKRRMVLTRWLC